MSPPTAGHTKGPKTVRRFHSKTFFFPFLSERGDCKYFKGCPSVNVFTQIFANLTVPMVNLKWSMTQKPDSTLEPSSYKHLPKIRMFSAEKSICPRRFIRDGPELLHTCSTCMSIPRPYLRGVLFTFAEYIWSYVVRTYTCIHVSEKSAES